MRRSIIVAAAGEKRVIGNNGQIPWRLPSDLKRFKQLTMGHSLIMGRKTHISIGKPLLGRTTIVVTRGNSMIPFAPAVYVAHSLEEALASANEREEDTEAFICGGGEIYREALVQDVVDRIYLTVIEHAIEGDTFFPRLPDARFCRTEVTHIEGENLPHRFEIWERVR